MAQLLESFISNDRPASAASTHSIPTNKRLEEEKSLNAQLNSSKAPAAPVEKFGALSNSMAASNQSRDNINDTSKASAKSGAAQTKHSHSPVE